MRHASFIIEDLTSLQKALASSEICSEIEDATGILVQIYCAEPDFNWITTLVERIELVMPNSILVGATTIGEVCQGQSLTGQTVVGFTFFERTQLSSIALNCPSGSEFDVGAELGLRIREHYHDIAGVLLLATPLNLSANDLLRGFNHTREQYPVFGGGAGVYEQARQSAVFAGNQLLTQGVVAVVMMGNNLHIESRTYLGWLPLSKEMTATNVEGMWVKTIDNKPAFDVYHRYLDIPNNDQFFLNSLEFPVLLRREERDVARVPVRVNDNGEVQFVADIKQGEKLRFGYGNPDLIISEAAGIRDVMRDFAPEVLFLYTCGCRRFLLQQEVEKETLPFETIAPTFGFYTYGEFIGSDKSIELLNSTMVVVGLREGVSKPMTNKASQSRNEVQDRIDPYADKHSRIISRLIHFIGAVTSELEQANREITQLSQTDRLTKLNNRMKLDSTLGEWVAASIRHRQVFSVILLDVDHFKQVNDTYGHLVGDEVLINVSNVLSRNIRASDIAGRWGGEEFLIVLPHTELEQACVLAEKLRRAIAEEAIPDVGYKTASFGVTSYILDETLTSLLTRVDQALYEAKKSGRNQVKSGGLNIT